MRLLTHHHLDTHRVKTQFAKLAQAVARDDLNRPRTGTCAMPQLNSSMPSIPPREGGPAALAGPHCGRQAMHRWRKALIGPVGVLACLACGRPVSIHWLWLASWIALLGGSLLASRSNDSQMVVVFLLAGLVMATAVNYWLVPLVPRRE